MLTTDAGLSGRIAPELPVPLAVMGAESMPFVCGDSHMLRFDISPECRLMIMSCATLAALAIVPRKPSVPTLRQDALVACVQHAVDALCDAYARVREEFPNDALPQRLAFTGSIDVLEHGTGASWRVVVGERGSARLEKSVIVWPGGPGYDAAAEHEALAEHDRQWL